MSSSVEERKKMKEFEREGQNRVRGSLVSFKQAPFEV